MSQHPLALPTSPDNSLAFDVETHIRHYFAILGDNGIHDTTDFYAMILQQVERPLFTVVYEQTKGNQSRMAEILGLNRGTLRKKLKQHQLIS